MAETILICTVGGAHQPILTAIRELDPAFVLFFATGQDAATGGKGSVETITGKGTPVEVVKCCEVVERLPNIPTQAGLAQDRFDHDTAYSQLEVYRARLGRDAGPLAGQLFSALKWLTAPEADPRRTPARLWDLWLNAQRRADQGRFDDAVARGYRLLEWTAQWLLGTVGIDTGDLRQDQIPADLAIAPGGDGKRQAGLRNAWTLAAHHLCGEVAQFVASEHNRMLDHLRKRNYSILAHGDRPIGRADWEAFCAWIESGLIPLLRGQAAGVGLKTLAPQLPRRAPWRPGDDEPLPAASAH